MKPIQEWQVADILDFLKSVDKKTWVRIGIVAVVAVLIGAIVIWPAWFKRAAIRSEIKSIGGQIASLDGLSKNKDNWLRNKEEYLRLISDAKAKLHAPGEASLLLGVISRLAKESKVSVVSSMPKEFEGKFPPPFDQQYEAKLYDFSMEGKYHDLGVFISKIESHPKLLRIQLFDLKPSEALATDNAEGEGDGEIAIPETQNAEISLSAVSLKKVSPQNAV